MKIFNNSQKIRIERVFPAFILVIFLSITSFAQSKTNLEVFYSFTDSISNKISENFNGELKEVKTKFNLGDEYYVFSNQLISSLQKKGLTILPESSPSNFTLINLVIDQTKVEYGEIFRDGMFGELKLERKLKLSGNYTLSGKSIKFFPFSFSSSDTIAVETIKDLESESFTFTKGNIPSEPFLSSLIEPAIVITAAAVSVILFFTIRSK